MSDEPHAIAEAGGPVDRASANLALFADDLDPAAVTAALGCEPTRAWRKGDVRKPGATPMRHGGWLLRVEGAPPTLPGDLLRALLARVPADPALWTHLRSRYRVRLGLGVHTGGWNRGFALGADVIRAVDAISAGLDFDLYFYGDDGGAALH